MIVREIIASVFFILGVFIYVTGVLGIYKFKYVLNKMHCAALGDTLGLLLIALGGIVYYGFTFSSAKLLLIVVFFWFTSPVASHLISLLETTSNPSARGKEYDEKDLHGKESE